MSRDRPAFGQNTLHTEPTLHTYILGLDVCPLSVLCPVLYLAVVLHRAGRTFREARPCISVLCSGPESVVPSPDIWLTGILAVSPGKCKSYMEEE